MSYPETRQQKTGKWTLEVGWWRPGHPSSGNGTTIRDLGSRQQALEALAEIRNTLPPGFVVQWHDIYVEEGKQQEER
jgi:hypothetical protein